MTKSRSTSHNPAFELLWEHLILTNSNHLASDDVCDEICRSSTWNGRPLAALTIPNYPHSIQRGPGARTVPCPGHNNQGNVSAQTKQHQTPNQKSWTPGSKTTAGRLKHIAACKAERYLIVWSLQSAILTFITTFSCSRKGNNVLSCSDDNHLGLVIKQVLSF